MPNRSATPMTRLWMWVRYELDTLFAGSSLGLIGLLGLATTVVVSGIAFFVHIFRLDPNNHGFAKLVWIALMRTLDPGTMGDDEGSWLFLLAMLAVTIAGIFIVGSLISILTTGLEEWLARLRKGRTPVVESDHVVILGWSPYVVSVVAELIKANRDRKGCIVIMGDHDKVAMLDLINEKIPERKNTRIVCRTGNPIDADDLRLVSLETAKSIIVTRSEGTDPDVQFIKVILAILNNPDRHPQPYHIVGEIFQVENLYVAQMVGGAEIEVVHVGDVIARIMAQTSRQTGLSVVYTELLDFEGNDIYFVQRQALIGFTFGEVQLRIANAVLIGVRTSQGKQLLNPPSDYVIAADDLLIVVARHAHALDITHAPIEHIHTDYLVMNARASSQIEHTLILGWNWRAMAILRELDHYVMQGSTVTLVANDPEGHIAQQVATLSFRNQIFEFVHADTSHRATLNQLVHAKYQHVIVLSYSEIFDVQRADAHTLVTLLHLRDIEKQHQYQFSIVSEMLDVRNRDLAFVTNADDFIVSDHIISLLLAQIAENKYVHAVYNELLDAAGVELYLKPVSHYVTLGVPVNFSTLLYAGQQHGEIVIGYRLGAFGAEKNQHYGVVINPHRNIEVVFSSADRLIVIAES